MTIIPSLLFGNEEWYYHQSFIIGLNLLYLFRYKLRLNLFRQIKKTSIYSAVIVLCLIFLLELPRFLVNSDGRNLILTVLNAVAFVTFFYIMSDVFYRNTFTSGFRTAHQNFLKIYVIWASFIVIASVSVFILTSLRIIDPTAYAMPTNISMNVNSNANELGTQYFFPLHLTIVTSDNRGLPFFSNYGVFCGLSHEPHIATYLVTPAFFLLQALNWSKRSKMILAGFFIFFMLLATSTTNLIAVMVVAFVVMVINIKNGHYAIVNIIFLLSVAFLFSFFTLNDLGFAAVKAKIDTSSGSSLDYSKNFLAHVVSPKEFWGDGAFNVPFPNAGVKDIGVLFSILCIGFYILMLIASIKLLLHPVRIIKFTGVAAFYFLLHTLKVVQLSLIYPYTIFIIFYVLIAFLAIKREVYKPA